MFTNKVFDREGEDGKQVSVTVKAVDAGEPSLEGVCSFTVEILDTNDNPPLFDRQVGLKLIFYHLCVLLNVSKLGKQIFQPKLLPKNEPTNLFFYPHSVLEQI